MVQQPLDQFSTHLEETEAEAAPALPARVGQGVLLGEVTLSMVLMAEQELLLMETLALR